MTALTAAHIAGDRVDPPVIVTRAESDKKLMKACQKALDLISQAMAIRRCVEAALESDLIYAAGPLLDAAYAQCTIADKAGTLQSAEALESSLSHPIAVLNVAAETTDPDDEWEAVWGAITLLKLAQGKVRDAINERPQGAGHAR